MRKPDPITNLKKALRSLLRKTAALLTNPRLAFCLGAAWFITNGWAYVFSALGMYFDIDWMLALGTGYLAIIWMPFTPEKALTAIIAILLLRILFPKDKQTLNALKHYRLKHQFGKRRKRGNREVCKDS